MSLRRWITDSAGAIDRGSSESGSGSKELPCGSNGSHAVAMGRVEIKCERGAENNAAARSTIR